MDAGFQTIYITEILAEGLNSIQRGEDVFGIIGAVCQESIYLVGSVKISNEDSKESSIINSLPGGYLLAGLFFSLSCKEDILKLRYDQLDKISSHSELLILFISELNTFVVSRSLQEFKEGVFSACDLLSQEALWSKLLVVHTSGVLRFPKIPDVMSFSDVENFLETWCPCLIEDVTGTVICKTSLSNTHLRCLDLTLQSCMPRHKVHVFLKLYHRVTNSNDNSLKEGFSMKLSRGGSANRFSFPISAITVLGKNDSITCIWPKVLVSIYRQILQFCNMKQEVKMHTSIVCRHYLPEDSYYVSILYLDENNDLSAIEREEYHKKLFLPVTFPFFRKSNSLDLFVDEKVIINVHKGLDFPLKVSDNIDVALVKGYYNYYHYGTGGLNDSSWGCAYRSLQTLVSWFVFQGYTTEQVPTHKAIQKCLVDLQDKPSKFLGSKQWIGSTEVGLYIQEKLQIDCHILHLNKASELDEHAGRLISHFRTNGCPIMIGGGSLAHTIIGACYGMSSGTLFTLILDPHFKGVDDISVIQKSGQCALLIRHGVHVLGDRAHVLGDYIFVFGDRARLLGECAHVLEDCGHV